MGKVIMEFDSIEEADDLRDALDGHRWKSVVWELDQHLRGEIKHNEELHKDTYAAYEELRSRIREIIQENKLTLE